MTAGVDIIVQIKLFLPPGAAGDTSMRIISAAVGMLAKHHLVLSPATPGDREALDGISPRLRIVFQHPDFPARASGARSFVTISAGSLDQLDTDFILVGMLIALSGDRGEAAWQAGLAIARVLAPGLGVSYAHVNGGRADDDRSFFPANRSAQSDELPDALTPWTYFGPVKLSDSRRKVLEELPAIRSRMLGDGWELQMVESLADDPPEDVVAALAGLEDDLSYMRPAL